MAAVIPTVPTPIVRWSSVTMREQVLAYLQAACPAPSGFWKTLVFLYGDPKGGCRRSRDHCSWSQGRLGILNHRVQSVICYTVGLRKGGSLYPDKDRSLPHLIKLAPLPEPKRQDTGTAILEFGKQVNLLSPQCPGPLASLCSVILKALFLHVMASGGPLLQLQLWWVSSKEEGRLHITSFCQGNQSAL